MENGPELINNPVIQEKNTPAYEETPREQAEKELEAAAKLSPRSFMMKREQWVKTGVISEEEANALPEIVKLVVENVTSYIKKSNTLIIPIGDWIERAKVMTLEELASLPEIKEAVKEELGRVREVEDGYERVGTWIVSFRSTRDNAVKYGFITAEEANALPEVVELAKENLVKGASDKTMLGIRINELTRLGIFSEEEILEMPEVIEAVNQHLRKLMGTDQYKWQKDDYLKMGFDPSSLI